MRGQQTQGRANSWDFATHDVPAFLRRLAAKLAAEPAIVAQIDQGKKIGADTSMLEVLTQQLL